MISKILSVFAIPLITLLRNTFPDTVSGAKKSSFTIHSGKDLSKQIEVLHGIASVPLDTSTTDWVFPDLQPNRHAKDVLDEVVESFASWFSDSPLPEKAMQKIHKELGNYMNLLALAYPERITVLKQGDSEEYVGKLFLKSFALFISGFFRLDDYIDSPLKTQEEYMDRISRVNTLKDILLKMLVDPTGSGDEDSLLTLKALDPAFEPFGKWIKSTRESLILACREKGMDIPESLEFIRVYFDAYFDGILGELDERQAFQKTRIISQDDSIDDFNKAHYNGVAIVFAFGLLALGKIGTTQSPHVDFFKHAGAKIIGGHNDEVSRPSDDLVDCVFTSNEFTRALHIAFTNYFLGADDDAPIGTFKQLQQFFLFQKLYDIASSPMPHEKREKALKNFEEAFFEELTELDALHPGIKADILDLIKDPNEFESKFVDILKKTGFESSFSSGTVTFASLSEKYKAIHSESAEKVAKKINTLYRKFFDKYKQVFSSPSPVASPAIRPSPSPNAPSVFQKPEHSTFELKKYYGEIARIWIEANIFWSMTDNARYGWFDRALAGRTG